MNRVEEIFWGWFTIKEIIMTSIDIEKLVLKIDSTIEELKEIKTIIENLEGDDITKKFSTWKKTIE